MRSIELNASKAFDEIEHARSLISQAQSGDGFSIEEMRQSLPILDRLDQPHDGSLRIELEEAQWGLLCRRLNAAKWNFVCPEIVTFYDKVMQAERVEPNA